MKKWVGYCFSLPLRSSRQCGQVSKHRRDAIVLGERKRLFIDDYIDHIIETVVHLRKTSTGLNAILETGLDW